VGEHCTVRIGTTRRSLTIASLLLVGIAGAGCSKSEDAGPPVATPSFMTTRARAPLGSPIEVTYKFVVSRGARIDKNYKVFVHFLDSDEEQMWTDDHEPPRPTSTWKEGETVQYTRTVFVPIYPYVGQATVRMGLYDSATNSRLPLQGTDAGQRSYTVGSIDLLPQSENVFLVFKDGWHPAESATDNPAVEWQWTKKVATLAFRNPKRDIWFYLHLDGRPDLVDRSSQPVAVTVNGQPIDQFELGSGEPMIRKVPVSAAQLGSGDTVEVKIDTGASFVPALTPAAKSRDPRELGVRVFHAFVEPK
jgi:hypothetical protein